MKDLVTIERLEKNSKGYSLTLSDRSEPITIGSMLIAKHRLKEGIVITGSQLEQLECEAENERCESEIRRLLALREHSSGEIKTKLIRQGFDRDIIDRNIKQYVKQGLIDDPRFAHLLAIRTFERKPCGYSYLVATLQKKMISRQLAETVVSRILSECDEVETAMLALDRKWRAWKKFDLETTRKKAYNYLSYRGISYQATRQALEKLEKEEQNQN